MKKVELGTYDPLARDAMLRYLGGETLRAVAVGVGKSNDSARALISTELRRVNRALKVLHETGHPPIGRGAPPALLDLWLHYEADSGTNAVGVSLDPTKARTRLNPE